VNGEGYSGEGEGGDKGERRASTRTHTTQRCHPKCVPPAFDSTVWARVRCGCGATVYARRGTHVKERNVRAETETREMVDGMG
jgi:hypothetical protein